MTINILLYQKFIICTAFTFIFVFLRKESKQEFFIRDLTERNFNKTLLENDFVLVMYYTSGCEPCVQFLEDFEYAGEKAAVGSPPVLFVKVNCAKIFSKKLCGDITGIPELKYYKFGRYADEFRYRDRENMAKLARKFASPNVEIISTKKQYTEYLSSTTFAVIGMFLTKCKLREAYLNVTNLMFERFDFAISSVKEVVDYQNIKQGIVVYKPWYIKNKYEEEYSVYNAEPDLDKIRYFLQKNYHGLMGYRRPDNKHEFDLPLLTVFYDFDFKHNADLSNNVRATMLKVANEYRDYLNFAMSRTQDWTGLLKQFGFENPTKSKPIVTFMDVNERKYIMETSFNTKNVDEFVRKSINKSLVPFVRSGPIPSKANTVIQNVVARNLEEVVMNTDNDTILYIYNPTCGVCQQMDVAYIQLAEKFKIDNLQFCSIDGTVNDLPKIVKPLAFPTIYFLKKNKKHKPIMYYGGPNLHDLIIFVIRYSTEHLREYDRKGKERIQKVEL